MRCHPDYPQVTQVTLQHPCESWDTSAQEIFMRSLPCACHFQGVSYWAMQPTSSFGISEEVFFGDFGTALFFQNYFVKRDEFRFTLFSRNYFSFSISYLLQLQSLQWTQHREWMMSAVIMCTCGNPRKTLIIIINVLFSVVQFLLRYNTICCSRLQCPVLINIKSRKAMRKKVITKLELPSLFTVLSFFKLLCKCLSSQLWFWSRKKVDSSM